MAFEARDVASITCIALQFIATFCVAVRIRRYIQVVDIKVTDSKLLVTTLGSHGLKSWWGVANTARLSGSGLAEFDEQPSHSSKPGRKYHRLVVANADQLQLPAKPSDQASNEALASSWGSLQLSASSELLNVWAPVPVGILWPLLSLGVVLTVHLGEIQAVQAVVLVAVGTVFGVLLAICWRAYMTFCAKTPIKKKVDRYRWSLLRENGAVRRAVRSTSPGPERLVTGGQIKDFATYFGDLIHDRNTYYVQSSIMNPLTAPLKFSFAEMIGAPKSETYFFVSHAWGSSFLECTRGLEQHAQSVRHDWQSVCYWHCLFSNNHWCDTNEPGDWKEISCFAALRARSCQGTCVLLDDQAAAFNRSWCLMEIFQTFESRRGSPNQQTPDNLGGIALCTSGCCLRDAPKLRADGKGFNLKGATGYDVAFGLLSSLDTLDWAKAKARSAEDKKLLEHIVKHSGGVANVNKVLRDSLTSILQRVKLNLQADVLNLNKVVGGPQGPGFEDRPVQPNLQGHPLKTADGKGAKGQPHSQLAQSMARVQRPLDGPDDANAVREEPNIPREIVQGCLTCIADVIGDTLGGAGHTWRCPACRFNNAAAASKCGKCGKLKPNSWTCASCNSLNNTTIGKCTACGLVKPDFPSPLVSGRSLDGSWVCIACACDNGQLMGTCGTCGIARPVASTEQSMNCAEQDMSPKAQRLPDFKREAWTCERCGTTNDGHVIQCEVCGGMRPLEESIVSASESVPVVRPGPPASGRIEPLSARGAAENMGADSKKLNPSNVADGHNIGHAIGKPSSAGKAGVGKGSSKGKRASKGKSLAAQPTSAVPAIAVSSDPSVVTVGPSTAPPSDAVPASGDWQCVACSALNLNSSATCTVCDTPQPTTIGRAAGSTSGDVREQDPSSIWICSICSSANESGSPSCAVCGIQRPGSARNKGNLSTPASDGNSRAVDERPATISSSSTAMNQSSDHHVDVFPRPANAEIDFGSSGVGGRATAAKSTWACSVCTSRNKKNARSCSVCGTQRPTSANSSAPASFASSGPDSVIRPRLPAGDSAAAIAGGSGQNASATSASASARSLANSASADDIPADAPWTCSSCSAQNPAADDSCGLCRSPKSVTSSVGDRGIPWNCEACGSINQSMGRSCSTCGTKRTGADGRGEGAPSVPNLSRSLWSCPVCTFQNVPSSTECDACGTPKQNPDDATR